MVLVSPFRLVTSFSFSSTPEDNQIPFCPLADVAAQFGRLFEGHVVRSFVDTVRRSGAARQHAVNAVIIPFAHVISGYLNVSSSGIPHRLRQGMRPFSSSATIRLVTRVYRSGEFTPGATRSAPPRCAEVLAFCIEVTRSNTAPADRSEPRLENTIKIGRNR